MRNLLLLPAILSLVACNALKTMDDMKDTTQDMNKTTKELLKETKDMGKTTTELGKLTSEMKKNTDQNMGDMLKETKNMGGKTDILVELSKKLQSTSDELQNLTEEVQKTTKSTYKDLRQGNSMTMRSERLAAMTAAQSMEAKIAEACKYTQGFEFQLWKNELTDDESRREELMGLAIEEFFRNMDDYLPNHLEDLNLDPASHKNNHRNLMAIAASIGSINDSQEDVQRKTGIAPISILSAIQAALSMKKDVEGGRVKYEELPVYAKAILYHEDQALYFLKLRVNFVAALVLAKLANIPDRANLKDKLKVAKKFTLGWAPNYSKLNTVQIKMSNTWLEAVIETLHFLRSIGAKIEFNGNLKKMFNKAKLDQTSNATTAKLSAISELNKAVTELKLFLN